MNSSISKNKLILSYTLAFILIFVMVAASMILKDPEIIFPEIAAMAIAMWVYREPGWIRQPSKIVIAPTVTAVIGFLMNQLPVDYIGKAILTLVLMMLFLRIIQSNLSPSLATGLLPIVVNAEHWSFIISVVAFSLIIFLGVLLFKLNKGLEKRVEIQYKDMVVFLVIHSLWIGLCWLFKYPQFALIPPIAVVAYESLQKPMYKGKMAVKQVAVLTTSAAVGSLLYSTVDSWILILLLNIVMMLLLLQIVGMRLPAVYAFPLLPFVFPSHVVPFLPVGSLIGSVFFFGSVWVYKNLKMKQNKRADNKVTV